MPRVVTGTLKDVLTIAYNHQETPKDVPRMPRIVLATLKDVQITSTNFHKDVQSTIEKNLIKHISTQDSLQPPRDT